MSNILHSFCFCRNPSEAKGVKNPYDDNIEGQSNKAYEDSDDEELTGFWVPEEQRENVLMCTVDS